MQDNIDLESMSEAERRTYFFSKKGYRVNNPTYARHLIMRRIKRRLHGTDIMTGLTDNKMCKIVDRILQLKVDRLYLDGYIDLGHGLGEVYFKPYEKEITDFHSVPVNYKKTLDYWAKNLDAYRKGIMIRDYSTTKRIRAVWKKNIYNNNLRYYIFIPQKKLKRKVYNDYISGKPIVFIQ